MANLHHTALAGLPPALYWIRLALECPQCKVLTFDQYGCEEETCKLKCLSCTGEEEPKPGQEVMCECGKQAKNIFSRLPLLQEMKLI
jgi:hypothetical protein